MKGAGGGKRGGRKPTRVESDDRPRGYEARRMRQLWRDIDDAKHKAGLAPVPEPEPAAAGSGVSGIFERATALVGDAAAWVQAAAPAACALLASGVGLLRATPVVGRLVDLAAAAKLTPGDGRRPAGHANGTVRPVVGDDPEGPTGPDGGWVH